VALVVIPVNISLCDATFKLAKEKENFSEWVRQQLLNDIGDMKYISSQPIDLEKLFDDRFRKGKSADIPSSQDKSVKSKSNVTPVLDDRYRKGES